MPGHDEGEGFAVCGPHGAKRNAGKAIAESQIPDIASLYARYRV
jgi:hypothetical protein